MAKTLRQAIIIRIKRFLLSRNGIVIHHDTVFGNVKFRGKALIEPFCRLSGDPVILIGSNFYMNAGCHLLGDITIGNNVQIGPKTVIWGRDHGMARDNLICVQKHIRAPIKIGDDVWIGANVTILKGVEIENGAVIGAGSVVVRSIPAYGVAVGNPACVIKYRR